MKRFAILLWALACAVPAWPQTVGIGIGANQLVGKQASFSSDYIQSLSPQIYLKADNYFVDGAIRIGDVPGVGAVQNYLAITDSALGSGTGGWSRHIIACMDVDTGADQTIASRAAASNYEWKLTWGRSTGFVTATCYTLNAASSITATSTTAVAIGTPFNVVWGYDSSTSKCWISVNNETTVVSSGTLTMATGTAADWLGRWFNATEKFNGRLDSYGVSIGSQYLLTNKATLYNSGTFVRYADLTTPTLTAWWDFGNATTFDNADGDPNNWEGKWDWLLDCHSGSLKYLTQAGVSTSEWPYVVKGLIAPAQTADTDTTVLGFTDSSGNANHAVQYSHCNRPGFKTISGKKWFYFQGTVMLSTTPGNEAYNTRWIGVPFKTADAATMTGTNKPWSFCCLFKMANVLRPSVDTTPFSKLYAHTLCGIARMGYLPWRAIGTPESTTPGNSAVRFVTVVPVLSPYSTYTPAISTRWTDERWDDAGHMAVRYDTIAGRADTNTHACVYVFDGTTATIYIDGTAVMSADQTQDNLTGAGAMGTMATKYFLLCEALHKDNWNRGVPPIEFGSGGKGLYGYMDRVAFWPSALTAPQVAAITDDLLGTTVHPLTGAYAPPTTTTGLTLLHWLDAAYGQMFKERAFYPDYYAVADGDRVGGWRDRIGTKTFSASTDAKRMTLKTNIQNGFPAVRSDHTAQQCLGYSAALAQPYTAFFVARRQTGTNEGYYFGGDSATRYFGHANTSGASMYMGGAGGISGTATSQTTTSLWKIRVNGASSSIVRDGTTVASGNPGTNSITAKLLGGIQDSGSLYFLSADFHEVRIYTGTDAGGEEAAITAELKAKWATP